MRSLTVLIMTLSVSFPPGHQYIIGPEALRTGGLLKGSHLAMLESKQARPGNHRAIVYAVALVYRVQPASPL